MQGKSSCIIADKREEVMHNCRPFSNIGSKLRDSMSGCRESNPDLTLPKRVYYHYTTPRVDPAGIEPATSRMPCVRSTK